MTMFTSQEKKNISKLLTTATNKDKVMTLDELHGFLFGLAIIPEMLMPSQWIPVVFGGQEMCVIDDEKEGERLLGSLFTAYNRICSEKQAGELVFPYDVKKCSADNIGRIRKWSHGLHQVLSKSQKLLKYYDKTRKAENESRIDNETFAVCYRILWAVAFPEKTPELLERIQKGVKSDVGREISDANFISMLPDAVGSIQEYAVAVQEAIRKSESHPTKVAAPSAPIRVDKIGRNDPCTCGSGAKYKKCCGK